MKRLEKVLRQLWAQEIGFVEFKRESHADFNRVARHLMRRWQLPEWFTIEDVEQELYLGAWRTVPKFDPSRGVTLSRFTLYGAISTTKRAMHRARGAARSRTPDRTPSCFELPASRLVAEDAEGSGAAFFDIVAANVSTAPTIEEKIISVEEVQRSATKALKACRSRRERRVVLAIRSSGSLDNAGRYLYDDIDRRVENRLGSETQADRFVRWYARAVARRVANAS